jgi:hypothetical protein
MGWVGRSPHGEMVEPARSACRASHAAHGARRERASSGDRRSGGMARCARQASGLAQVKALQRDHAAAGLVPEECAHGRDRRFYSIEGVQVAKTPKM